VNELIKIVTSESDVKVRSAAAEALGAMNVPSNQASALILQQVR
jgi:HEAT repeat protein